MNIPGMTFDKQDHRLAVLWAADCAEHVLPYFEKECPKDGRPRKAIEEARAWVREGKPMRMSVIRIAALDAHAAARATDDVAARAAARAAGQAVATVHVVTHAPGAAYYGAKAAEAAGIAVECEWQYSHIPERVRARLFRHLVYLAAVRIPKGMVATYGQLAELAGNPRGARAVGMAMKCNPDIKRVPCHRVVAADGTLRGYAFGKGVATKKKMLVSEGVKFIGDRVDLNVSGWKK